MRDPPVRFSERGDRVTGHPYSTLPRRGNRGWDRLHIGPLLHSSQDKSARHSPPPLADPSLERPQQFAGESARILFVQFLQQDLGDAVRFHLEPKQYIRPNLFERIRSGPPGSSFRRRFPLRRTRFTQAP